jgi:hypothetical protein
MSLDLNCFTVISSFDFQKFSASHRRNDLGKAACDVIVAVCRMRQQAVRTILAAFLVIFIVTAAAFAEHIQWAVAKKAVKAVGISGPVAREIPACLVGKVRV